MASSPLRSPTGEIPPSSIARSPRKYHTPPQSPSRGPASSDNHSIPPSSPLNDNNSTNSLLQSPPGETLQSPIPRSQNYLQSPLPSLSRGTASSGNHSIRPSSPLSNHNTTSSPLRSPANRTASSNHLSTPHSPLSNNKQSQFNNKTISSPQLSPLHLRASKPSIQIQPPSLNSLSESEPSPSPLAIVSNPINDSNKRANFDEEAVDSPLRTVNLDRSDGPERVTGGGGGSNRVVAEAVWRAEVRWAVACLRALAVLLCMVSFLVMAADRTKGWDGDSYHRYEEYRYVRWCFSFVG